MSELSNINYTLPATWSWSIASEVCRKIQDGTHFSPKNQIREGKYRYVTAKNVRPSGLDLRDITYLTAEDHKEIYRRCDTRKGDVLLVKDGVNTGDAAINTIDVKTKQTIGKEHELKMGDVIEVVFNKR